MHPSVRIYRRTAVRLIGLTAMVAAAVATGTAQQEPSPLRAALPDCSQLDELSIPMQMNLRAAAAMVACGRDPGGEEAKELGIERDSLVGGNVDVITGTETNPHVVQSEHQIWANGQTVVVHFNDSRDLATTVNVSGVSVSTDGGVTYARLNPSPFKTGHGSNFGDPTVVFSKAGNIWTATDLVGSCGAQGIGMWTSADGLTWSPGACVHSGSGDDRQSHTVDNNPASPFYGRQYISWNNFAVGGGALQLVRSTDNGATWSAAVSLQGSFIRDVQIQVAPNGTVFVAAMNEGGGGFANRTNVMFRSTDGGVTFASTVMGAPFAAPGDSLSSSNSYFAVVNPIWRHMGWGDLATGDNNVVIYTYCQKGAGSDTGNIYIQRSTDSGATWAAPLRIDGDSGTRTQWMPSMAGGGRNFFASWYDRKNTANFDYERWGVISRDGGVTWSRPRRVSDMIVPQPNQGDPSIFAQYAGDYMRSFYDAATQTFFDGWTDGRILVAGANQQDVETQRFKASAAFDFEGDAKTDRTIFRPSNGVWYTLKSNGSGANITGWGIASDIDVPGDYDGDGKADLAVYRSGTWLILRSSNGTVLVDSWGVSGDIPLAGDVDGDGKADLVVFRPSAGVWFAKKSGGGTLTTGWGVDGDVPLMADYDADGKDDITIYRPGSGVWYILLSGGGSITQGWGVASDIPIVGDFDGDGKADIGVFRPSSGQWLILRSSNGTILAVTWGTSGDTPVSGDLDGDGMSDFTIFRDATGVWFTQFATGGTAGVGWGISGDKPAGRQPGT